MKEIYQDILKLNDIDKLKLLYVLCDDFNLVTIPDFSSTDNILQKYWKERYNNDCKLSEAKELKSLPSQQSGKKSSPIKRLFSVSSSSTQRENPQDQVISDCIQNAKNFRATDAKELIETLEVLIQAEETERLIEIVDFCSLNMGKPIVLNGKSLLHCLAEFDEIPLIKKILMEYSEVYVYGADPIIFLEDNDGNNFLHLLNKCAIRQPTEVFVDFLNFLIQLDDQIMVVLLTQKNRQGKTPLNIYKPYDNRLRSTIPFVANPELTRLIKTIDLPRVAKEIFENNSNLLSRQSSSSSTSEMSIRAHSMITDQALSTQMQLEAQEQIQLQKAYSTISKRIVDLAENGLPALDAQIDWLSGLKPEKIRNKEFLENVIENKLRKFQFLSYPSCLKADLLEQKRILYVMRRTAEFIQSNGFYRKDSLNTSEEKLLTEHIKSSITISESRFRHDAVVIIPMLQRNQQHKIVAAYIVDTTLQYAFMGGNTADLDGSNKILLDSLLEHEGIYQQIKLSREYLSLRDKLISVISNINLENLNLLSEVNCKKEFCLSLAEFLRGNHFASKKSIIKKNGRIHECDTSLQIINHDLRQFINCVHVQFDSIRFINHQLNLLGLDLGSDVIQHYIKLFYQGAHTKSIVSEFNIELHKMFFLTSPGELDQHIKTMLPYINNLRQSINSNLSQLHNYALRYWLAHWQQVIVSDHPHLMGDIIEKAVPNQLLTDKSETSQIKIALKKDIIDKLSEFYSSTPRPDSARGNYYGLLERKSTHVLLLYLRDQYELNDKLYISTPLDDKSDNHAQLATQIREHEAAAVQGGYESAVFLIFSKDTSMKIIFRDYQKNQVQVIHSNQLENNFRRLLDIFSGSGLTTQLVPNIENNSVRALFTLDKTIQQAQRVIVDYPRAEEMEFGKWLVCQMIDLTLMDNSQLQKLLPIEHAASDSDNNQGSNNNNNDYDIPVFDPPPRSAHSRIGDTGNPRQSNAVSSSYGNPFINASTNANTHSTHVQATAAEAQNHQNPFNNHQGLAQRSSAVRAQTAPGEFGFFAQPNLAARGVPGVVGNIAVSSSQSTALGSSHTPSPPPPPFLGINPERADIAGTTQVDGSLTEAKVDPSGPSFEW